jgi:type I restriction enzyme S subunit
LKTIKLKKIANVITGFPFKGEQYSSEGTRTVRGENVTEGKLRWDTVKCWNQKFDKEQEYLLKADDVVIGMDGSKVGKNKAQIKEKDLPLLLAQRVACIRSLNGNNQVFLYYLINNPRFEGYVFRTQTGSSVPHISKTQIEDFEVPQIDLLIQQKIAKVLSDLDLKIQINNRINSELEAMAKTLYDYWFVQFDFPDANGKPYKTSGGKMVWNAELKREIPVGWEVKLYSDWINNDKSGDWGKEQPEGNYTEKVYCIRGADINGLNGTGELKSPERYILEKNLHKTLDPADLIVEISGGSPVQSTGRLAFITEGTLARFDAPIICSNFCKAVTLKNKKLLYNFVYHWKSIYDAGVLFGYEGKTSGIKNLLFDSFVSSHYTIVPEETLAEKFYDFMESIQAKKQKNLKENQELALLRDWLLPMLMNGQVSVGDAEEELGMVAESGEKYNKIQG